MSELKEHFKQDKNAAETKLAGKCYCMSPCSSIKDENMCGYCFGTDVKNNPAFKDVKKRKKE